jgi:hypothetical protein
MRKQRWAEALEGPQAVNKPSWDLIVVCEKRQSVPVCIGFPTESTTPERRAGGSGGNYGAHLKQARNDA